MYSTIWSGSSANTFQNVLFTYIVNVNIYVNVNISTNTQNLKNVYISLILYKSNISTIYVPQRMYFINSIHLFCQKLLVEPLWAVICEKPKLRVLFCNYHPQNVNNFFEKLDFTFASQQIALCLFQPACKVFVNRKTMWECLQIFLNICKIL